MLTRTLNPKPGMRHPAEVPAQPGRSLHHPDFPAAAASEPEDQIRAETAEIFCETAPLLEPYFGLLLHHVVEIIHPPRPA